MHELSIAQAIIAEADRVANREPGQRVLALTVRIGALSGVDPDALLMIFPLAAEDTAIAGARLDVERVPARVKCSQCRQETAPEFPFLVCPECGSDQVEVLAGRDLLLQSVELEPDGSGTTG